MNNEYHYKALLRSIDCGAPRAAVFASEKHLNWQEAAEEAPKHLSSQTCIRCKKNHTNADFVTCDVQGELVTIN